MPSRLHWRSRGHSWRCLARRQTSPARGADGTSPQRVYHLQPEPDTNALRRAGQEPLLAADTTQRTNGAYGCVCLEFGRRLFLLRGHADKDILSAARRAHGAMCSVVLLEVNTLVRVQTERVQRLPLGHVHEVQGQQWTVQITQARAASIVLASPALRQKIITRYIDLTETSWHPP